MEDTATHGHALAHEHLQIIPLPPTRDALHSEPDKLRREIDELASQIQGLVLDNFRAHVSSFRCEADVKKEFNVGSERAARLDAEAEDANETIASLEAPLSSLQVEHNRLRKTLGQQSTILEVLDAPSLMESCVRAGLAEEALDVADYATSLYFTHKLWMTTTAATTTAGTTAASADSSAEAAAAGHHPHHHHQQHHSTKVIRSVVREVRHHCDELRASLLRTLSGKVALPQALAVLGHLRRLYSQQALAKRRVRTVVTAYVASQQQHQQQQHQQQQTSRAASGAASAAASSTSGAFSPSDFSLTEAEEEQITFRLLQEFLHCRGEVWHAGGELGLISKHSPYNYLLRVIEAQRSQWADIAAQYNAVASSLLRGLATAAAQRTAAMQAAAAEDGLPTTAVAPAAVSSPTSAAAAAAATELSFSQRQQRARAMLFDWLRGRIEWFVGTLEAYLPKVAEEDSSSSTSSVAGSGGGGGAAIPMGKVVTLATQSLYAARRAGRLGLDYSHLIAPIFARHVEAALVGRLLSPSTSIMSAFEAEVNAWEWAYKPAVAAVTAAPPSSGSSADSTVPLSPSALLPHPPLATLANNLFSALNSLRTFLPQAVAYPLLAQVMAVVVKGAAAVLEVAAVGGSSSLFSAPSSSPSAAGAAAVYNDNSPVAILTHKLGRKLPQLPASVLPRGASAASFPAPSGGGKLAPLQAARGLEEHAGALRRFEALCASFTDGFCGAVADYLAAALNAAGNIPASSALLPLLTERGGSSSVGAVDGAAEAASPYLGAGFALQRLQRLAAAASAGEASTSSAVSIHPSFDQARLAASKTMAAIVKEHTKPLSI